MSRRHFLGASAAGAAAAVVLGAAGSASAAPRAARTPSGLLTSLLPDGLGVTAAEPRLSWQVADLGPGTRQTHYQVQFATTPARLESGPRVWDSGRVASAASVAVPYGGPALSPQTPYWWRVRTFDGHRSSRWSAPALLATGVAEWTAEPIWAPAAPSPGDGVLTARVQITSVAASLWFRASGTSANYLWQLRAGSPGVLKKHVCVNGAYRVLEEKRLPTAVETGRWYDVTVEMTGSTFRTSIDGTEVDTTTDATYRMGTVGMRNGSTEANAWDRVALGLRPTVEYAQSSTLLTAHRQDGRTDYYYLCNGKHAETVKPPVAAIDHDVTFTRTDREAVPYRLNLWTGEMRRGTNTIEVEVATTLNKRLRVSDPDVYGTASRQRYGLLGPVRLVPYAEAVIR